MTVPSSSSLRYEDCTIEGVGYQQQQHLLRHQFMQQHPTLPRCSSNTGTSRLTNAFKSLDFLGILHYLMQQIFKWPYW